MGDNNCYYPECDAWAEWEEDPAQTDLWGKPAMIHCAPRGWDWLWAILISR